MSTAPAKSWSFKLGTGPRRVRTREGAHLQDELLVHVALGHGGLEVRALQKTQKELIDQLEEPQKHKQSDTLELRMLTVSMAPPVCHAQASFYLGTCR